jgi:trans-aconitate 2-methyltransferase
MTLSWSPERYARHAGARLRPALDLLAHVPLEHADSVVDLGCGAGALFPALRRRFPQARLTGVDVSAAMLAGAAEADPDVELVDGDAASWRPDRPADLIVANAALHWVPDHRRLIPDLLRHCRVLAVQVPDNFASPAYRLIREVMTLPPWAERLAGIGMGDHVLPAAAYVALLREAGAAVDLWQTIYHQQLTGADAVLDWVSGTTLLPVQAALGGAGAAANLAFEAALAERLRGAYPADAGGTVLFPFQRLFFVASTAST